MTGTDGKRQPFFVIVSGPAAAGKSTLSRALAAELQLPLLSKDIIKAAMRGAFEPGIVPARQIGQASVAVLLAVAAQMVQGAVIDSVWRGNQAIGLRDLFGTCVEVFCSCAMPVLEERYAARVRPAGYVPEHTDKADLWSPETMQPIGGLPLIEVDTTTSINFQKLVSAVNNQRLHIIHR